MIPMRGLPPSREVSENRTERRECARPHAEYRSRSVMTRSGEGLGAVVPDALSGRQPSLRQAAGQCCDRLRLRVKRGVIRGPLVFRPLMKRPVDPVAEGVGGLVRECLVQIAEDNAHEEVLLPRLGSQATDR